jgi:hypothetical protein
MFGRTADPAKEAMEDTETANDATDASEDQAMVLSTPAHQAHQRRRVVAVATSVGLLAAVGSVLLAGVMPLVSDIDSGVSLASDRVVHRMGCSNWHNIVVESTVTSTPDLCAARCKPEEGWCSGYNYQPAESTYAESKEAGACYLNVAGCKEESNPAWDLYSATVKPNATIIPAWVLNTSRVGCTNWQTALMSNITVQNGHQCAYKCKNTVGCKAANFQPGPCAGTEMSHQGACFLYNQICELGENSCWDLYSPVDKNTAVITGVPVTANKGDYSINTGDDTKFPIGSQVQIGDGSGNVMKNEVTGHGSIILLTALEFTVPSTTGYVMLISTSKPWPGPTTTQASSTTTA